MVGTLINVGAIVVGGAIGLAAGKEFAPRTEYRIKMILGVVTIYLGMKTTWDAISGSFGSVVKQVVIVLVALVIGNVIGKALRIQKGLNKLGEYARKTLQKQETTKLDGEPGTKVQGEEEMKVGDERMAPPGDSGRFAELEREFHTKAQRHKEEEGMKERRTKPKRFADGFVTCTLLFCVGPMAILGALEDGLSGRVQTLAIKSAMDGLATMAFVKTFGLGPIFAAIPVLAYQGTITLMAEGLKPVLTNHMLLDSINATGGLLILCISVVILDIQKVPLADYLPSLVVAPLLTWLFR